MAGRPRQSFRRATTTTKSCLRARVDVPDDAVLDVPNKYGKALVWYSKSWRSKVTGQEGDFYIRCFLPGELY